MANNLRIIHINKADASTTTILGSSTASAATSTANLKKDTRSAVWRTGSRVSSNFPVIFKTSTSYAIPGAHSGFTVTSTAVTGSPATFCTVTGSGETEAAVAVPLPYTFVPDDNSTNTSYTVRTYTTSTPSSGSTLRDVQVVPVILSLLNQITVVCSNSTHRLQSDNTGAITSYAGTGCNVWVFEGCTPLRYDGIGTALGTFNISAAVTSGTATVGSVSVGDANTFFAAYVDHSGIPFNASATNTVITYTVTGTLREGTAIPGGNVTTQTLSKLASGVTFAHNVYTTIYSTVVYAAAVVTLDTASSINAVVLTLGNISKGANIRFSSFNVAPTIIGSPTALGLNLTGVTILADGKNINGAPWNSTKESSLPSYATNTFGLDRAYIRAYIPSSSTKYLAIEIMDLVNTSGYLEFSRLILGTYWSPAYNTGYGMSTDITDTSTSERSEAGDLITTNGVVYNKLSFDLDWMTGTDRDQLVKLLKIYGSRLGVYISLFPEDLDPGKENLYQIYGKLAPSSGISHPYLSMYATSVEIEEI